ncbi:MAG: hypothetical protein AB7F23_04605 [Phycisphaerae bacterium]
MTITGLYISTFSVVAYLPLLFICYKKQQSGKCFLRTLLSGTAIYYASGVAIVSAIDGHMTFGSVYLLFLAFYALTYLTSLLLQKNKRDCVVLTSMAGFCLFCLPLTLPMLWCSIFYKGFPTLLLNFAPNLLLVLVMVFMKLKKKLVVALFISGMLPLGIYLVFLNKLPQEEAFESKTLDMQFDDNWVCNNRSEDGRPLENLNFYNLSFTQHDILEGFTSYITIQCDSTGSNVIKGLCNSYEDVFYNRATKVQSAIIDGVPFEELTVVDYNYLGLGVKVREGKREYCSALLRNLDKGVVIRYVCLAADADEVEAMLQSIKWKE